MNEDIKIKKLLPDDWDIFRTLRLRCLDLHSDVFCPIPGEYTRPDTEWKQLLENPESAYFVLEDEGLPIGLTGIVRAVKDISGQSGFLVMSFIEPNYRGRGLSKLFYEARISWAREHSKYNRLVVAHTDGNDISKAAILKNGFSYIGREEKTWPCGSVKNILFYEFNLVG